MTGMAGPRLMGLEQFWQIHHAMLDSQDFKRFVVPTIEEQISWVTSDVQTANVRRCEIKSKSADTWLSFQEIYRRQYFRVPMAGRFR